MSWWERVKAALSREARDTRELGREVAQKLDTELTRRERDLSASPDERLDTTLEEIASSDREFDELSRTVRQPGTDVPAEMPPQGAEREVPESDGRSSAT